VRLVTLIFDRSCECKFHGIMVLVSVATLALFAGDQRQDFLTRSVSSSPCPGQLIRRCALPGGSLITILSAWTVSAATSSRKRAPPDSVHPCSRALLDQIWVEVPRHTTTDQPEDSCQHADLCCD